MSEKENSKKEENKENKDAQKNEGKSAKENPKKSAKTDSKSTKKQEEKKNIFQKYPLVFLLLGALLISILWGILKVNRTEKALTEKYELKLQEQRELLGEELGRTFSWVMRSELTRNNQEQAEQYMVSFIKGDLNISRISYYDKKEGKITLSTDRKFKDKKVDDEFILKTDAKQSENTEDGLLITAPVMGLDNQLGVIIINLLAEKEVEIDED